MNRYCKEEKKDELVSVNLFCSRSCYSCAPYVIAYWHQNQESFCEALTKVFQYYQGTPKQIIFDNAKVAVKSGFGSHAVATEKYAHLAAHYGFKAVFCNPASGNEKGLVENLVGYIRRNVCVPLPKVASLAELNAKLLEECLKYGRHTIEGKSDTVGTMLAEERTSLQKLPKYMPDISKKCFPKVSRYSTVLVETNRYSVPCKYTGKETTVSVFPNRIEVWIEGKLVASHERCQKSKQESLRLEHYLPLLKIKSKAIPYAKPVRNNVPIEFLEWIQSQSFSAKQMYEALEKAVSFGYYAVMKNEIPESQIDANSALTDKVSVVTVNLESYDNLLSKIEVTQ